MLNIGLTDLNLVRILMDHKIPILECASTEIALISNSHESCEVLRRFFGKVDHFATHTFLCAECMSNGKSVRLVSEIQISQFKSNENSVKVCAITSSSVAEIVQWSQLDIRQMFDTVFTFYYGAFTSDSEIAMIHREITKVAKRSVVSDFQNHLSFATSEFEFELSIVVPVYNVEAYIGDLLKNIEDLQRKRTIEVILVDDGSTDNSGILSQSWCEEDITSRRYIKQDNAGAYAARNRGLKVAKGEYVMFVDADDVIQVDGVMRLIDASRFRRTDVVQGLFERFSDGERPFEKEFRTNGTLSKLSKRPRDYLYSEPAIWRNIYNKEFLYRHGISFPPFRRFDDLPFHFMVGTQLSTLCEVENTVYFYRLGRSGQDTAARDERLFIHFDIFNWLKRMVVNNHTAGEFRELLGMELSSHFWACRRIDTPLKKKYAKKALAQLFTLQRPFSFLDTLSSFTKRTRTWGAKQVSLTFIYLLLCVTMPRFVLSFINKYED